MRISETPLFLLGASILGGIACSDPVAPTVKDLLISPLFSVTCCDDPDEDQEILIYDAIMEITNPRIACLELRQTLLYRLQVSQIWVNTEEGFGGYAPRLGGVWLGIVLYEESFDYP